MLGLFAVGVIELMQDHGQGLDPDTAACTKAVPDEDTASRSGPSDPGTKNRALIFFLVPPFRACELDNVAKFVRLFEKIEHELESTNGTGFERGHQGKMCEYDRLWLLFAHANHGNGPSICFLHTIGHGRNEQEYEPAPDPTDHHGV